MNPFKILLELKNVGFDGCINADHIPELEGDQGVLKYGLAYSVGYIKAMFAALVALP
jgi:mannonate dehydratase